MKILITHAAYSTSEDIEALKLKPDSRKATRNMLFVQAALEKLGAWENTGRDLGVVLGTGHGELISTTDFLSDLGVRNLARPFLFQNSLHNSTLGFISQKMKLVGPGFSVSEHIFTGERSLELAATLLHSRVVTRCLVIGVDTLVPALPLAFPKIYRRPIQLGEGAAALLLSTRSEDRGISLRQITYAADSESPDLPDGFYDSDAIKHVALAVIAGKDQPIYLSKPNGAATRIVLERN